MISCDSDKVKAIKIYQEMTRLNLIEAKEMIVIEPNILFEQVSQEQAEKNVRVMQPEADGIVLEMV